MHLQQTIQRLAQEPDVTLESSALVGSVYGWRNALAEALSLPLCGRPTDESFDESERSHLIALAHEITSSG